MIKRNLLLERDFLIFDPSDALYQPVELDKPPLYSFRKTAGFGITLQVWGTVEPSDLIHGTKTVHDMEVTLEGEDITNGLPESFLQELVNECVENAD